jgi:hypothetical protein
MYNPPCQVLGQHPRHAQIVRIRKEAVMLRDIRVNPNPSAMAPNRAAASPRLDEHTAVRAVVSGGLTAATLAVCVIPCQWLTFSAPTVMRL